MTKDPPVDLHDARHARSSTNDADRKHCPECGSVSLSKRGTSISGLIQHADYHCEFCGEHVDACRDTPGECDHD